MYSNDLTELRQSRISKLFVGFLYYYQRNPIHNESYDYAKMHDLCKFLLMYKPSIYRDQLYCKFYTQRCLKCGSIVQGGSNEFPFTRDCYKCNSNSEGMYTGNIYEVLTLKNPMYVIFTTLPCVVQEQIYKILLDSETHSLYNGCKTGDNR